jgi:hypothetical protein
VALSNVDDVVQEVAGRVAAHSVLAPERKVTVPVAVDGRPDTDRVDVEP